MCKIRMSDGSAFIDCIATPAEFCELWELAIESKTMIKVNTSDFSEKYLNPMQVVCVLPNKLKEAESL